MLQTNLCIQSKGSHPNKTERQDILKEIPPQLYYKRKYYKSLSQENEKPTRKQTMYQKSPQKDKHLDCHSYLILDTILEVDERRTLKNGQGNKKTHDGEWGLTSDGWHWPTICQEKKNEEENDTYKIFWNFEIQMDHLISARRSDLVMVNKKREPAE